MHIYMPREGFLRVSHIQVFKCLKSWVLPPILICLDWMLTFPQEKLATLEIQSHGFRSLAFPFVMF